MSPDPERPYRAISLSIPTDAEVAAYDVEERKSAALTRRLQVIADEVRRVYIMQCRIKKGDPDYGRHNMERWDGGRDSNGRRHNPIWPKIAANIATYEADPFDFIVAQFWQVSTRVPLPNMMIGQEALARYQTYQEHCGKSLAQQLDYELMLVQAELVPLMRAGREYVRAVRYAVSASFTKISTLLRYCIMVQEGQQDLAAVYHDRALFQYTFQKAAYDSAWGSRIPELLKEEGETLRRQIISRG